MNHFCALSEQERVRTSVRPGHRRNDPLFDWGTRAGRANRERRRSSQPLYLFALRDLWRCQRKGPNDTREPEFAPSRRTGIPVLTDVRTALEFAFELGLGTEAEGANFLEFERG